MVPDRYRFVAPLKTLAVASALALQACLVLPMPAPDRNWVQVPNNQSKLPEDSDGRIDVDDRVRILASNGKTYKLRVLQVNPNDILGRGDDGKNFRIPYSSIEKMEAWWIDGVKAEWAIIAPQQGILKK